MLIRSPVAAALTRLLTGREIAGYEVRSLIGRGGMSEVYEAFDPRLDRTVALKVLTPELTRNRSFRDRFIRESQTAASLSHPNVIPIFEAGEDGDILFIAMLLVRGYDLGTLIEERGRLEPLLVSQIIAQTAEALDCAHDAGLLHRDVKPANLMLTRGLGDAPHVYLTDFGLTKSLGRDSRITETGQLIGSVHYVCPEHVEGKEMDRRADVYSLGCVLYECLTGAPPFERESDMAVLWAHVGAEIPRPSKKNRRLPDLVDRVLARSLAKDPLDRFATCGELAESFASALEGVAWNLPTPAPRPRVLERGRIAAWTRRALAAVTAIALTGTVAAWGMGAFTSDPPREPVSGNTQDPAPSKKRADGERIDRVARSKSKNGSGRQHRSDLRDRARAAGSSVTVASGSSSGRRGASDVELPLQDRGAGSLEATRTLSERYDVTASNLRGVRDCSPDDTARGCIVFDLRRDESFADIAIADDAGLRVAAWVRQDSNGDDRWEGSWIPVCGRTPESVEVSPGARVQVLIDQEACNYGDQPTTGLIELTLYRRGS